MQGTMDPVFGEVRHQDGQEELQQPGQASHRCLQTRVAQDAREASGGQQDQERRDPDGQMGGQEVHHVQEPLGPEDALLRIGRPQHLDRREDERHEQQVEQEPIQPDGWAIAQCLVDRDGGAAQQGRGQGEQHPGKAQDLLPAQERGHDAEDDRRHDDGLDQHPHEGHGVVRPQLGRAQHLREMQAHHRPEREQSEER